MGPDGLVQDCSNSIANALELLQSCTKPLIWVRLKSNLEASSALKNVILLLFGKL